ncbi:hypothetical protein [Egicoccus sp. AB-alg6-2]|uniref:hypothetical protein n=1 Tax=Egicoccus sp. AB-alg6-2 TaxID=3242692 RepID=UPI00359D5D47
MAKIPDQAQYRRDFAALTLSERRAVARAVNRGVAVEKRKHAPLAVVLARRQMKLWRYAWVFGALIGLVAFRDGWLAVLVNSLIGVTMLGLVGRHWYTRARRAEQANLALADGRGRGRPAKATGNGDVSPAGRWLPRRRARE